MEKLDYNAIRKKINKSKDLVLNSIEYEKGLSIIIPVYDGMNFIDQCLNSIFNQKIVDAKYELIIIFNGKYADSINYLYDKYSEYINVNLLVLINDEQGAGAARNLGVRYARYSHTTFVDIDDYISDTFIQANFNNLYPDTISVSQIYDLVDGVALADNVINNELLSHEENLNVNYFDIKRILTITACKAVPTKYFEINKFNQDLKSGEDTVLFTELLVTHQPKIHIIPIDQHSTYYRNIRVDSVSRQPDTYEFLISQRLDILEILDPLLELVDNRVLKNVVIQKYDAQILFMNRYLKANLNEWTKILKVISSYNFKFFKYNLLNRNISDTLVISYCFPPYSDTSALVMTKRIIQANKIVDVISNNMSGKRTLDNTVLDIVEPLIGKNTIVQKPVSFSDFTVLQDFIDVAFREYLKYFERYKELYTRAMFPISHIPGLFIKLFNKDIIWKAEFSDPLLKNIESKERYQNINNESFIDILRSGILGEFSDYVDENLFNLVELIPFALADELIFTNENQMAYMISRFPKKLQEYIVQKAVIDKHPTLESRYYSLNKSNIELDDSKINIAYFGNFYSNRSISDVLKVVRSLRNNSYLEYEFHVFTNIKNIGQNDMSKLLASNIKINSTVDYLEFLNLCNKFDGLLVFDARTSQTKPFNPYLPSKISDYLGSDSTIISVNEKNSPLDKINSEKIQKLYYNDNELYNVEKLENVLLRNKDIIVFKNDDSTIIKTLDYELEYLNTMNFRGGNYSWSNRVKESPVSFDENYLIHLTNKKESNLTIQISSKYDKDEIIDLCLMKNEQSLRQSITYFNEKKTFDILPGETLSLEWIYSKEYKKRSFVKAGEISFEIIV